MQSGSVSMMVTGDPNARSFSRKGFTRYFSISIGEKIFLMLLGKLSLRQIMNGRRRVIIVAVVLW
jgi:hypothetical protein